MSIPGYFSIERNCLFVNQEAMPDDVVLVTSKIAECLSVMACLPSCASHRADDFISLVGYYDVDGWPCSRECAEKIAADVRIRMGDDFDDVTFTEYVIEKGLKLARDGDDAKDLLAIVVIESSDGLHYGIRRYLSNRGCFLVCSEDADDKEWLIHGVPGRLSNLDLDDALFKSVRYKPDDSGLIAPSDPLGEDGLFRYTLVLLSETSLSGRLYEVRFGKHHEGYLGGWR